MAAAIRNSSGTDLRQNGKDRAAAKARMRIAGEVRLFRVLWREGPKRPRHPRLIQVKALVFTMRHVGGNTKG
jgi:hypothetical protein